MCFLRNHARPFSPFPRIATLLFDSENQGCFALCQLPSPHSGFASDGIEICRALPASESNPHCREEGTPRTTKHVVANNLSAPGGKRPVHHPDVNPRPPSPFPALPPWGSCTRPQQMHSTRYLAVSRGGERVKQVRLWRLVSRVVVPLARLKRTSSTRASTRAPSGQATSSRHDSR